MMTRRRYRRRAMHQPGLTVIIVMALLVLVVLPLLAHALGFLVLAAAAGFGCWRAGLARRPVARPVISQPDPGIKAELDQARADRAQLERVILAQRAQLDELEDLTGKTTDELLATYRRVRKQYGPAATGRQ